MLSRAILDALRDAVDGDPTHGDPDAMNGAPGLITAPNQLQTYECDGLTNFRTVPDAVALPRTAEQVQAVVRVCAAHKISFVARGSATGLSGGALPAQGGL